MGDMDTLKDKVVIITGSSSGIGASAAVEFSKLGAKVTITGRNEARIQKTMDECLKNGGDQDNILKVTADLQNEVDIKKIVDSTIEKFGKIDVLVNNAAKVVTSTIDTINLEDLDDMYRVNVRAVVHISQLCIPYLKETKGNIVIISGVAGTNPVVAFGGYGMTKAAEILLTKVLALECGKAGIRVNCISLGHVKTGIFGQLGISKSDIEKMLEFVKPCYPLGRVGEPREVAKVITFLASDAASLVTGSNFCADGGMGITTSLSMLTSPVQSNEDE